jgi:DNA-binding transcriptional LysR family regulator
MQPELRLIRYFVAVAEEQHFTRAAKRLHMAQPPLSAAIRQLEQQLGVALLDRRSRNVRLTAAGELLLRKGRELLAVADDLVSEVRAIEGSPSGLLHVGFTPAARYGLTRTLLERWSSAAPGVMVRAREDTTDALVQGVIEHKLDLALVFCPPPIQALGSITINEPAVVHLRADHRLAHQRQVSLDELRAETFLVAGGKASDGYTAAVFAACRAAGFEPTTRPDPYPDLGIQAVREGLGIVLYAHSGFPTQLEGTMVIPVVPEVQLPFVLLWRDDGPNARLRALLDPAATPSVAAGQNEP